MQAIKEGSKLKIYFLNSWSAQWGDGRKGWFYYDDYKPFLTEAWGAVDLPDNWLETVKQLPRAKDFVHAFIRDIAIGEKSDEVMALQTALMIDYVNDLLGLLTIYFRTNPRQPF